MIKVSLNWNIKYLMISIEINYFIKIILKPIYSFNNFLIYNYYKLFFYVNH